MNAGRAMGVRPAGRAKVEMSSQTDTDAPDAEAALLARYAAGDAAAARLLSAAVLPRVYAHAVRVLGDAAEAEDVAQDAMMRLWRIAPAWRTGEARVTTWLYRVVANLCTDRLRLRRTIDMENVAEPEDPALSAEAQLQREARHDALQQALDTLPDRQRQAVVLRHIDGLANPEIAAILDIGVEAVESLTARGKKGLAAALAGQRDALGFEGDG
jgi:RNA polymerase sigma-70 factor (ECF subfamily)